MTKPTETEVYRHPTAFELKQGYGALHWLTVPVTAIYHPNGKKRHWLLNPYIDDGLRYYVAR